MLSNIATAQQKQQLVLNGNKKAELHVAGSANFDKSELSIYQS